MEESKKTVVSNIVNLNEKLTNRLQEMGFVKNQKVRVVKNFKKSRIMIVCVRSCLVSIDYNLSKCIIVREGVCE